MADLVPNKTVSSATTRPSPSSNSATMASSISAPTHRVKKLLETYTMTAERTMLGPATISDMDPAYGKFFSGYHHSPPLPYASPAAYKLPPDVELSKTSPEEERHSEEELDAKRLKREDESEDAHQPNGLVTLSRIEDNGPTLRRDDQHRHRHGSSHSDRQRTKSGDSSHSGSSGRHLTGEMIRQLQEQQRKDVPCKTGPASPAALASGTAHQHQQLLHSIYERALKEKSYLKESKERSTFKAPAASGPVFSIRDRGLSELEDTKLAGKDISCFVVGGERRLCLPQILNSVLDKICLPQIHAACDLLQIYCSTCTAEQLEVLKVNKIIPISASQCGLITKSDAERLCSNLLERNPPLASMTGFHAKSSPFSFRVRHECFGGCEGIVLPEAYTAPHARCIECLECEGLFCPQKFVSHAHHNRENRTCHWGFDSNHWRAYLLLSKHYTKPEMDKLNKNLTDFKSRYSCSKRKQDDGLVVSVNGGLCVRDQALKRVLAESAEGTSSSSLPKKSRALDAGASFPPLAPPAPLPLPLTTAPASAASPATVAHVQGQPLPTDPAYGLYLYQSWAQVAAAAKLGSSAVPNPSAAAAAAAAWSAHMTQAVKDGKNPMSVTLQLPGSPSSFPVTAARLQTAQERRGFFGRSSQTTASVKSSPVSDDGSPSQGFDALQTTGDAASPTATTTATTTTGCSSTVEGRRSSSSSRPSLAEDINSIRVSLDGASSATKEKILKVLERLTTRLAMAESERDEAISQCRHLQKRYELLEEELQKKRAELREALRHDAVQQQHLGERLTRSNGGNVLHRTAATASTSSVTLELLSDSVDNRQQPRLKQPSDAAFDEFHSKMGRHAKHFSTSSLHHGLPKIDLKSPARILEDKEHLSCSSSRSSRSSLSSGFPAVIESVVRVSSGSPSPPTTCKNAGLSSPHQPMSPPREASLSCHRRRSTTPASIKSKQESEDLRERMLTMEAELRALRQEVENRSRRGNEEGKAPAEERCSDDQSLSNGARRSRMDSEQLPPSPTPPAADKAGCKGGGDQAEKGDTRKDSGMELICRVKNEEGPGLPLAGTLDSLSMGSASSSTPAVAKSGTQ